MKLTAQNVDTVFKACLVDPVDAEPRGMELTEMVMNSAYLDTSKHTEDIKTMLEELDDDFRADMGGGTSFLKAAFTKENVHWGEHVNMGLLFGLGNAAGLSKFTMPREMWGIMPGGMPYITTFPKETV
jgi:hypothetical protein